MSLIGEDCHYFITGGCTRGNQCCFRHQPAARTTEKPCPEWIQGKCLNTNCSLRHIPVDRSNLKRKATTPCFYDSHPNGCLNPHCQFLHTKRNKAQTETTSTIMELSKITQPEVSVTASKPLAPVEAAVPVDPVVRPKTTASVSSSLIPPPPAPVRSLPPALGTPTIVNGVLTITPSRGILGPTPNQIQAPSVQILPPLVTQHAAVRANLLAKTQPLGIDQNSLPKTGHFNEQVRLFKEMLSAKQKTLNTRIDNGVQPYNDGSDSFSSEEEERKSRGRNKRKTKKGRRDRSKKKSKEPFSKADEEVLYGDYKNVPLDKKHKKNKNDRKSHNDANVEVKSYEQVLREKALRKMIEKKRKEEFENDFEDLLFSQVEKKKSRRKKSKSDGDENDDFSHSHENRKESIDLDNVVFSKEDAVELGVDEDEFDSEINSDKRRSRKHKEQSKRHQKEKSESRKKRSSSVSDVREANEEIENDQIETVEKESPEENGVLIIPDETTDLTFSVDDTDDLALELNQEPETVDSNKSKKSNVVTKKASRSIVRASRSTGDLRKDNSRDKKPHMDRLELKTKGKRNVMILDSDSPCDDTKAEDVEPEETKKVISLTRREEKKKDTNEPKQAAVTLKIKTFEEIMKEKRKRKLLNEDVVVLSDGGSSPKKSNEILKQRSEKFKSVVLKAETSVEEKSKDVVPPKKSAAQLRREKLQLAKQEYEKKRRSMQLYQVKSAKGQGTDASEKTIANASDKTVTNASIATAATTTPSTDPVPVKKVKLQRQNIAKTSEGGDVSVRSFEEIMKEKRLRKQQQQQQTDGLTQSQQKRVDPKPLQSFLRRRSLSNQRNNMQPEKAKTTATQSTEVSESPAQVVASPPVAKVIGRRRSSSPSVVPQVESKAAPIKLRRNLSNSDSAVPSISPVTDVNSSTDTVKSKEETKGVDSSVPSSDEASNKSIDAPSIQSEIPEPSREDIQEALDEKKRLREQDILSDDEFEKEMNDLLSDGDDDDEDGDVNDDDFMMELEQMIDS